jgi:hypothetical protein
MDEESHGRGIPWTRSSPMFLKNVASYKEALLGHPKDNKGTHHGHGSQEMIRAID